MGAANAGEDVLAGFSEPVPFARSVLGAAGREGGVEVVWDHDGTALYVGETSQLRTHLRSHLTGDRESSVLHKKVGLQLDHELGRVAAAREIESYLSECTVAWRLTDRRGPLKAQLMDALHPRFNEVRPSAVGRRYGQNEIGGDLTGSDPRESLSVLLDEILTLQSSWTKKNSDEMKRRGLLVRRDVPKVLQSVLGDGSRPEGRMTLSVEGGDGTGLKTRVPWIRVFSPLYSSSATQGWYVAYLFSFDGSAVYLSLNQGTTYIENGDIRPRPMTDVKQRVLWATELLRDDLAALGSRLTDEMRLHDEGSLGDGYEKGDVAAFKYAAGKIPDDDRLAQDLNDLAACLATLYDKDATSDSALIADVPPDVGKAAETGAPFTVALVEEEAKARGLLLDSQVIPSTVAALLSGKNVIFTGPPGTAKTTLAEAVAAAGVRAGLCTGHLMTTATSDWTTFETVGGLRPAGDGTTLEFARGQFLSAIEANQWLVIDELNRSNFDRAFGQLFTVLSGQSVELPYLDPDSNLPIEIAMEGATPATSPKYRVTVQKAWRVIATMNVFDKSLLFEMSFALMRRFSFIEVSAPSVGDFKTLILRAAEEEGPPDPALEEALLPLLALRGIKDLGPAIYMDMARFAQHRLTLGVITAEDLAFQLFYSYLLPQFEGIDDRVARQLFQALRPIVGTGNAKRLRQTLRDVLGVEIPSQPGVDTSTDAETIEDLEDDSTG